MTSADSVMFALDNFKYLDRGSPVSSARVYHCGEDAAFHVNILKCKAYSALFMGQRNLFRLSEQVKQIKS
jgi:hypothetical protein